MVFFQKSWDNSQLKAWVPTGALDKPLVYLDVQNHRSPVGVTLTPALAKSLGRALIKAAKKAEDRALIHG